MTILPPEKWINGDRSELTIANCADPAMQVVLRIAANIAVMRLGELETFEPEKPFDLDYYLKCVAALLSRKNLIAAMLSGDLREEDVW